MFIFQTKQVQEKEQVGILRLNEGFETFWLVLISLYSFLFKLFVDTLKLSEIFIILNIAFLAYCIECRNLTIFLDYFDKNWNNFDTRQINASLIDLIE